MERAKGIQSEEFNRALYHLALKSPNSYYAILKWLSGEPYKAASEDLGISLSAYKQRLELGRRHIANYLELYDAWDIVEFFGIKVTKRNLRKIDRMFPKVGRKLGMEDGREF